jgi:hypothetical protein
VVVKSLTTPPKSLEEAASFSIETIATFMNLFCDAVERRCDLISFVLPKERSHDATELAKLLEFEELMPASCVLPIPWMKCIWAVPVEKSPVSLFFLLLSEQMTSL